MSPEALQSCIASFEGARVEGLVLRALTGLTDWWRQMSKDPSTSGTEKVGTEVFC